MTKYSGKGTIETDNSDIYVGEEFKDSLPLGTGRMTHEDGRIVEEIWYNGEIVYKGELNDDGEPHGKGKWKSKNGTYEGDWVNGKRHGKGTIKVDGGSYKGEWKEGKRHGNGIFTYPDGGSYEGEWKDDEINGKGVMTYANQDIYDGEWKDDYEDGEGTMKYANGDVYKGGFSHGEMHGHGVFQYAAGNLLKSTGEWKDGKKCGEFEDIPRPKPVKVYYNENGEIESEVKVKREVVYDEDTDTEDFPPSKRRNVSLSPA